MFKKFSEENFFGVISKKMITIDSGNTVPICIHYLSQFMLVSALNIEPLVVNDEKIITNRNKAPLKIFMDEGQNIFDELLHICDTDDCWTKFKSISILGTAILRTCDILTASIHNIKERGNLDDRLNPICNTLTNITQHWQNHNCEVYTLTQLDYIEPIDELFKSNLYKFDSSFFQNFIRNSLKDFLNVCINTDIQKNNEYEMGLFWILDDNQGHEFFAKVISNIFKNIDECYNFHHNREENISSNGRSYTSGYNKIIDSMLEDFPENNNITQVLLHLCGNKKQNFTIETFRILRSLQFYTVKLNNDWKDKMTYDPNRKISITNDKIVLDNGEIIPPKTPFMFDKTDTKVRFHLKSFNYWHVVWKEWTSFFDVNRNKSKIMTPSLRRFMKLICKFIELNATNVHELLYCLLDENVENMQTITVNQVDSYDGPKHNISILCFFLLQSFTYLLVEVRDLKLL